VKGDPWFGTTQNWKTSTEAVIWLVFVPLLTEHIFRSIIVIALFSSKNFIGPCSFLFTSFCDLEWNNDPIFFIFVWKSLSPWFCPFFYPKLTCLFTCQWVVFLYVHVKKGWNFERVHNSVYHLFPFLLFKLLEWISCWCLLWPFFLF